MLEVVRCVTYILEQPSAWNGDNADLEKKWGPFEDPNSFQFPGGLESFQVAWKVSMVAWKSFQVALKVSRWPGMFPGGLESFQVFWKVSRWTWKFLGGLESFHGGMESFRVAWNISRWPGKFPGGLESFQSGLESHTSKVSRRHLHSPESHQSSLL